MTTIELHPLDLFADDFCDKRTWIEVCKQLDIPKESTEARIAFVSVDFKTNNNQTKD